MARPQAVQAFLDALFPAMMPRAPDFVARIEAAVREPALPGAKPTTVPATSWFAPALDAVRDPALFPLVSALAHLSGHLCWRPRAGDPTASAGFEQNHANAMILGPGGIEEWRDVWIGMSVLAPKARYPDHRHAPAEAYLVLSRGTFLREGQDWVEPGEGGSFTVPPNALHAMRAPNDAPLLALWALWPEADRKC